MHNGALLDRLRRIPGVVDADSGETPDLHDEASVDLLARRLLERFRQHADGDAFTLLFELTHERLAGLAGRIVRRLAPHVDPEELVGSFMARQFADVHGSRPAPVRQFLALAYTSMRNEVLDHLRHSKRARAGGRLYHDTLPEPKDPAAVAEAQEEDDLLARYGATLAELTDECFHQLEPRDKHVLVARELLGLSYERVAGMLALHVDQVGMVIRRARQHLADRLVARLTGAGHRLGFGDGPGDALSAAQTEVLAGLVDRERTKNVRSLVQHVLQLSVAEGRRRLADLVYELAKACLVSAPGFTERLLVRSEPRARDVVTGDLRKLAARLAAVPQGGDAAADVDELQRRAGDALDDAARCLDVLARIEGPTGRQQVACALLAIHRGEPAAGEALLRPLLAEDLPAVTRQNVFRNLTLALLRQDRHADARDVAEQSADEWPDDPVRLMNLCFCTARLHDRPAFLRHREHLLAVQRESPQPRVATWIADVLPELDAAAGLRSAARAPDRGRSAGEMTS